MRNKHCNKSANSAFRILHSAFLLLVWAVPLIAQFSSHNFELIGSLELSFINADVWAHGNYAYVGTWSAGCPGTGVKIIDTSNPREPRMVAVAGGEPNTSAEDMVVRRVDTPFFRGDLLGVGLQSCGAGGRRGLALLDVTVPAAPQPLGFFALSPPSPGVHELDLMVRGDRAYALLGTIERFVMVDITDPRNPVRVSDWHLTERLGEPLIGDAPLNSKFTHSALASPDGSLAILSYWDAGAIILDISDPAEPRFVGRTGFGPGEEGNTHSVSISADNRLLLTADEDCSAGGVPGPPYNDYGFLRVFDISNPREPSQLSIFHSPHSKVDPQRGPSEQGTFCIHNPVLVGKDLAFLSWYSDGVRAVDLSDPKRPQEIAWFIGRDQVWGVHVQPERDGLVLASDERFGLYLLRATEPRPNARGLVDAASFRANVAPGSIVSLFGTSMAGASAAAGSLPLPTRLAGTRVLVNGTPAPLFYVSPAQINFQLPDNVAAGAGSVRIKVENALRPSDDVVIDVAIAAPGIFTSSGDGRGVAAALYASDQSLVSDQRPARSGDVVQIYASGLNGAAPAVTIGGRSAEVLFAGRAPGFVGLWQVNVRIPPDLPRGHAELQLSATGAASNVVTLPIG